MKLYVYTLDGSSFGFASLLRTAVQLSADHHKLYGLQDDCLVRYCDLGVATHNENGSTGNQAANFRQFTSEIPVLMRILQVR